MPNGRKRRRVALSTTKSGVGRGHKSKNQKQLEKDQKKIKRGFIKGEGVKTGGFRHGRKRVDYRGESNGVRRIAQKSLDASIKTDGAGKNDAQVQAAINKMNEKTRRVAIKTTPATLGNRTVVGSVKKRGKTD